MPLRETSYVLEAPENLLPNFGIHYTINARCGSRTYTVTMAKTRLIARVQTVIHISCSLDGPHLFNSQVRTWPHKLWSIQIKIESWQFSKISPRRTHLSSSQDHGLLSNSLLDLQGHTRKINFEIDWKMLLFADDISLPPFDFKCKTIDNTDNNDNKNNRGRAFFGTNTGSKHLPPILPIFPSSHGVFDPWYYPFSYWLVWKNLFWPYSLRS